MSHKSNFYQWCKDQDRFLNLERPADGYDAYQYAKERTPDFDNEDRELMDSPRFRTIRPFDEYKETIISPRKKVPYISPKKNLTYISPSKKYTSPFWAYRGRPLKKQRGGYPGRNFHQKGSLNNIMNQNTKFIPRAVYIKDKSDHGNKGNEFHSSRYRRHSYQDRGGWKDTSKGDGNKFHRSFSGVPISRKSKSRSPSRSRETRSRSQSVDDEYKFYKNNRKSRSLSSRGSSRDSESRSFERNRKSRSRSQSRGGSRDYDYRSCKKNRKSRSLSLSRGGCKDYEYRSCERNRKSRSHSRSRGGSRDYDYRSCERNRKSRSHSGSQGGSRDYDYRSCEWIRKSRSRSRSRGGSRDYEYRSSERKSRSHSQSRDVLYRHHYRFRDSRSRSKSRSNSRDHKFKLYKRNTESRSASRSSVDSYDQFRKSRSRSQSRDSSQKNEPFSCKRNRTPEGKLRSHNSQSRSPEDKSIKSTLLYDLKRQQRDNRKRPKNKMANDRFHYYNPKYASTEEKNPYGKPCINEEFIRNLLPQNHSECSSKENVSQVHRKDKGDINIKIVDMIDYKQNLKAQDSISTSQGDFECEVTYKKYEIKNTFSAKKRKMSNESEKMTEEKKCKMDLFVETDPSIELHRLEHFRSDISSELITSLAEENETATKSDSDLNLLSFHDSDSDNPVSIDQSSDAPEVETVSSKSDNALADLAKIYNDHSGDHISNEICDENPSFLLDKSSERSVGNSRFPDFITSTPLCSKKKHAEDEESVEKQLKKNGFKTKEQNVTETESLPENFRDKDQNRTNFDNSITPLNTTEKADVNNISVNKPFLRSEKDQENHTQMPDICRTAKKKENDTGTTHSHVSQTGQKKENQHNHTQIHPTAFQKSTDDVNFYSNRANVSQNSRDGENGFTKPSQSEKQRISKQEKMVETSSKSQRSDMSQSERKEENANRTTYESHLFGISESAGESPRKTVGESKIIDTSHLDKKESTTNKTAGEGKKCDASQLEAKEENSNKTGSESQKVNISQLERKEDNANIFASGSPKFDTSQSERKEKISNKTAGQPKQLGKSQLERKEANGNKTASESLRSDTSQLERKQENADKTARKSQKMDTSQSEIKDKSPNKTADESLLERKEENANKTSGESQRSDLFNSTTKEGNAYKTASEMQRTDVSPSARKETADKTATDIPQLVSQTPRAIENTERITLTSERNGEKFPKITTTLTIKEGLNQNSVIQNASQKRKYPFDKYASELYDTVSLEKLCKHTKCDKNDQQEVEKNFGKNASSTKNEQIESSTPRKQVKHIQPPNIVQKLDRQNSLQNSIPNNQKERKNNMAENREKCGGSQQKTSTGKDQVKISAVMCEQKLPSQKKRSADKKSLKTKSNKTTSENCSIQLSKPSHKTTTITNQSLQKEMKGEKLTTSKRHNSLNEKSKTLEGKKIQTSDTESIYDESLPMLVLGTRKAGVRISPLKKDIFKGTKPANITPANTQSETKLESPIPTTKKSADDLFKPEFVVTTKSKFSDSSNKAALGTVHQKANKSQRQSGSSSNVKVLSENPKKNENKVKSTTTDAHNTEKLKNTQLPSKVEASRRLSGNMKNKENIKKTKLVTILPNGKVVETCDKLLNEKSSSEISSLKKGQLPKDKHNSSTKITQNMKKSDQESNDKELKSSTKMTVSNLLKNVPGRVELYGLDGKVTYSSNNSVLNASKSIENVNNASDPTVSKQNQTASHETSLNRTPKEIDYKQNFEDVSDEERLHIDLDYRSPNKTCSQEKNTCLESANESLDKTIPYCNGSPDKRICDRSTVLEDEVRSALPKSNESEDLDFQSTSDDDLDDLRIFTYNKGEPASPYTPAPPTPYVKDVNEEVVSNSVVRKETSCQAADTGISSGQRSASISQTGVQSTKELITLKNPEVPLDDKLEFTGNLLRSYRKDMSSQETEISSDYGTDSNRGTPFSDISDSAVSKSGEQCLSDVESEGVDNTDLNDKPNGSRNAKVDLESNAKSSHVNAVVQISEKNRIKIARYYNFVKKQDWSKFSCIQFTHEKTMKLVTDPKKLSVGLLDPKCITNELKCVFCDACKELYTPAEFMIHGKCGKSLHDLDFLKCWNTPPYPKEKMSEKDNYLWGIFLILNDISIYTSRISKNIRLSDLPDLQIPEPDEVKLILPTIVPHNIANPELHKQCQVNENKQQSSSTLNTSPEVQKMTPKNSIHNSEVDKNSETMKCIQNKKLKEDEKGKVITQKLSHNKQILQKSDTQQQKNVSNDLTVNLSSNRTDFVLYENRSPPCRFTDPVSKIIQHNAVPEVGRSLNLPVHFMPRQSQISPETAAIPRRHISRRRSDTMVPQQAAQTMLYPIQPNLPLSSSSGQANSNTSSWPMQYASNNNLVIQTAQQSSFPQNYSNHGNHLVQNIQESRATLSQNVYQVSNISVLSNGQISFKPTQMEVPQNMHQRQSSNTSVCNKNMRNALQVIQDINQQQNLNHTMLGSPNIVQPHLQPVKVSKSVYQHQNSSFSASSSQNIGQTTSQQMQVSQNVYQHQNSNPSVSFSLNTGQQTSQKVQMSQGVYQHQISNPIVFCSTNSGQTALQQAQVSHNVYHCQTPNPSVSIDSNSQNISRSVLQPVQVSQSIQQRPSSHPNVPSSQNVGQPVLQSLLSSDLTLSHYQNNHLPNIHTDTRDKTVHQVQTSKTISCNSEKNLQDSVQTEQVETSSKCHSKHDENTCSNIQTAQESQINVSSHSQKSSSKKSRPSDDFDSVKCGIKKLIRNCSFSNEKSGQKPETSTESNGSKIITVDRGTDSCTTLVSQTGTQTESQLKTTTTETQTAEVKVSSKEASTETQVISAEYGMDTVESSATPSNDPRAQEEGSSSVRTSEPLDANVADLLAMITSPSDAHSMMDKSFQMMFACLRYMGEECRSQSAEVKTLKKVNADLKEEVERATGQLKVKENEMVGAIKDVLSKFSDVDASS